MENYESESPVQEMDMNSVLSNTFFRMFLGLIASALTAIYVYKSGLYINLIANNSFRILAMAEFVVVIIFSLLFRKLSATVVTVLYFAYAFLNGFTFSVIFAVFDISSIAYVFLGTSAFFGVLWFIGAKTERDLTNWGTILTTALFISLIISLINLFLGNTLIEIILDTVLIFVFAGITIYDINKIKQLGQLELCEPEKLYVYGAMQLYLDFINTFLRILALFGKRRD